MKREDASSGRSMSSIAARGAFTTFAAQGARILIQTVSIVILARLLTPADYGVTVMVSAIIGVSEVLRDFGLSSAAIQARSLSSKQRSNLFWTNTSLGLVLAAVTICAAPLIGSFYNDSRLTLVAQVMAATFFFNGISTQHRASLSRSLRFGPLAAADIIAQGSSLVLAVSLAVFGAGYWALVAQQVGGALVAAVLVLALARWAPRGVYVREPMRELFAFGGHVAGAQLLTYATRNFDSVAIGYYSGPKEVGLYDRAFQLLMLPLNQLVAPMTRVAVPVLAKLQEDRSRYMDYLLRGQSVMLNTLVPVFAIGIVTAPWLIPLVLGSQWAPSAPLFQALAVAGIFRSAGNATHWVALSLGVPRVSFELALISAPVTIAAIWVGTIWGAMGVAAAVALVSVVFWAFGYAWYSWRTEIACWPLFTNSGRAVAGHGVAAGLASMVWVLPVDPSWRPTLGIVLFVLVECVVILVWPRYRHDLWLAASTFKHLRR